MIYNWFVYKRGHLTVLAAEFTQFNWAARPACVGYLEHIFEDSRFYACSIKEPPEILHYIGDENSVMCEKCLKLRNEHGKTTSFEPCLSTCERPT